MVVDWVQQGYTYLLEKRKMIKRGFEVYGVTSTDPKQVRHESFCKEIMARVQKELKSYDEDALFNDDSFTNECLDLDI